MKKVLIATTALVMTAGVAAAEVSLSGNGRMGVVYNGSDWNFSSRARAVFTLSGTTDGGMEFGASFRADNAANGADDGNAGSIWVSGAFGKIAMGDVDGAAEALFGNLPSVGYLGDDQTTNGAVAGTNNIPYLSDANNQLATNNPNLLYTYSAGAFSVAASMSDGNVGLTSTADDQMYAVAAAYTFGNYTVGLGYEVFDPTTGSDVKQISLAGVAKFGNTDVKAYYADRQDGAATDADDAMGVGVSSKFGATTVNGYIQTINYNNNTDVTWYGLGVDYDLGGGAVLSGAIQDDNQTNTDMVANVGVRFNF